MKIKLAEGTYVIGDPKPMLHDDVDPLFKINVEPGVYLDQYHSRLVINSGVIALAAAETIKHPHILQNVINNNGCCGKQVNGNWWILGWTRQFSVLWTRRAFEVDDDKLQIGPLELMVDS